jgi:SDR family mycofactocin-dependent oxidoreductase
MSRLEGRVAFITGAGHGQGRSHALKLAEEGADIVATDVAAPVSDVVGYPTATMEELEETAALVGKLGRQCLVRRADVRDFAALEAAVDDALATFGRIDIAVANAGLITYGRLWEQTEEQWDVMSDICLKGVWNTVRAVVPPMIGARRGAITITSSATGLRGAPMMGSYSAMKWGVIGLGKSFAIELAPYNVRVNIVHPTGVRSFMTQSDDQLAAEAAEAHPDLFAPVATNLQPGVDLMDPIDISNAIAYLVSDDARHVTGTQMVVDAGYSAKP